MTDTVIVGEPVDPSPLNDKVAIAVLISLCEPLNPTSVKEFPEQSVGSADASLA